MGSALGASEGRANRRQAQSSPLYYRRYCRRARETKWPAFVLLGNYHKAVSLGTPQQREARMALASQDGENKSQFYKARAEEFRLLAQNAVQSQSRDTFLGLAKTYDRVARLAAEREARQAADGAVEVQSGVRTSQGRRGNGRMDAVDRRSPLRQIDMSCPRCRRHMRPTLEQLAVAGQIPCPCCGSEVGLDGARYRSLVARLRLPASMNSPRGQQNGRNRSSMR
jgi:hypothetical protein